MSCSMKQRSDAVEAWAHNASVAITETLRFQNQADQSKLYPALPSALYRKTQDQENRTFTGDRIHICIKEKNVLSRTLTRTVMTYGSTQANT